jgi:hypothetical protein
MFMMVSNFEGAIFFATYALNCKTQTTRARNMVFDPAHS